MPTVFITGASTGIGRSTALRLAGSDWTVMAGVRSVGDGDALVDAGGERIVPIILDVTDSEQIVAAAGRVDELTAARGGSGLDALINNAGIGIGGPLEIVSIEDLRRQFEVNVVGLVAVTQAMLPALRRARGRIVIMSSGVGRAALPFNGPYGASKHAIEAIADAWRGELHSSNVSVVVIEPGSVNTPMWDKARADMERSPIPPRLTEQYGHVPLAVEKAVARGKRFWIEPERVAKSIQRALTTRRPRPRYVVGPDARGLILAKTLLSDRAFDRLARRVIGG